MGYSRLNRLKNNGNWLPDGLGAWKELPKVLG